MKNLSLFTIYFSLLLLLASCGVKQDFDATGTFEADEVTLSAETSGRLLAMNAEEGMTVKQGDVLAVVDTAALYLQRHQLAAQQSALLKSRPDIGKQVASLRSQIDKQQREVTRIENLLKGNAATQKQLDDAEAQLGVLRNQLDATLSQLGSSSEAIEQNAAAIEWQMKQLTLQLERSRIVSPIFVTKNWRNLSLIGSFVIAYLGIISTSGFSNSERFLLPGLPGLLIMAAYGVTLLDAKNYRFVKVWYWVVPVMAVAWAYFKLGSRGLF